MRFQEATGRGEHTVAHVQGAQCALVTVVLPGGCRVGSVTGVLWMQSWGSSNTQRSSRGQIWSPPASPAGKGGRRDKQHPVPSSICQALTEERGVKARAASGADDVRRGHAPPRAGLVLQVGSWASCSAVCPQLLVVKCEGKGTSCRTCWCECPLSRTRAFPSAAFLG